KISLTCNLMLRNKFYLIVGFISLIWLSYDIKHLWVTEEKPEIFFIASESDDSHYNFVIAHPPKDGNKLIQLILANEKTLTLPNTKYSLIYFKETRNTPRNFDSTNNIPFKCPWAHEE